MPSLRITVDDKVVMDGDMGTWTTEPPFISEQKLAIAAKKDQPWAIPVLSLVAKAATGAHIQAIDIRTGLKGWTLSVTEA